jgi:hypothetical protein
MFRQTYREYSRVGTAGRYRDSLSGVLYKYDGGTTYIGRFIEKVGSYVIADAVAAVTPRVHMRMGSRLYKCTHYIEPRVYIYNVSRIYLTVMILQ